MSFARAVAATSGLILRKLPKPRFSPFCGSNIDLCDLTTRDFQRRNPVKAIVDVILNHNGNFTEADVKKCVTDGDMDALPAIAKPPVGAAAVNHFTQTAFISSCVAF
jgi:hypothetical protein